MELLTCPLIVSRHGFSGRAGGVSQGPFASLNTSYSVGDDKLSVDVNVSRLASAAGVRADKLLSVTQVHTDCVVNAALATPQTEADALWTDVPSTAVAVRTADCLPILIEDPRGRVMAVHAGWRGVISEIVTRAVEQLVALGAQVSALRVAVGPCIQRCCFEVSGDLPARFEAAFGAEVVLRHPTTNSPVLDLPRAVRISLNRLGIRDEQVGVFPQCTACDAQFFSHRRDKGLTGRQMAFITCDRNSDL